MDPLPGFALSAARATGTAGVGVVETSGAQLFHVLRKPYRPQLTALHQPCCGSNETPLDALLCNEKSHSSSRPSPHLGREKKRIEELIMVRRTNKDDRPFMRTRNTPCSTWLNRSEEDVDDHAPEEESTIKSHRSGHDILASQGTRDNARCNGGCDVDDWERQSIEESLQVADRFFELRRVLCVGRPL